MAQVLSPTGLVRGRFARSDGSGALGCDALVFFGASGDLAYKQIFPGLAALVKRGVLGVPIIGVARAGWTVEEFTNPPPTIGVQREPGSEPVQV
jgi:hypothetical protein